MSTGQARVLGEGSFGCVLKPPVPCTKEENILKRTKKKQQQVGKVFYDQNDYETEVLASKRVIRIDPRGKHILGPTSHCETTFDKVSSHPAADGCENVRERVFLNPSTPMYQITMPYGGQRYDKYIKLGTTHLTDFVKHMIHVLEGVHKLQRHNTCHQDLKASNLLIDIHGNVMIIDYSLMMSFDEVYSTKNIRRLHHSYFPYPPEYKIFYLIYKKVCEEECSIALRQVMKNLEHYGERRREIFESFHGSEDDIRKYVSKLYTYTIKLYRNGTDQLLSAYTTLAKKVDVYSVGTIMMDMDSYIIKKGVSKAKIALYRDAIRCMTMVDPRKRATVTSALKKLRAIV